MSVSGCRIGDDSRYRSTAARIRLSLSPKARKIVPSATPAASAICREVTSAPRSSSKRDHRVDDHGAAFIHGERTRAKETGGRNRHQKTIAE